MAHVTRPSKGFFHRSSWKFLPHDPHAFLSRAHILMLPAPFQRLHNIFLPLCPPEWGNQCWYRATTIYRFVPIATVSHVLCGEALTRRTIGHTFWYASFKRVIICQLYSTARISKRKCSEDEAWNTNEYCIAMPLGLQDCCSPAIFFRLFVNLLPRLCVVDSAIDRKWRRGRDDLRFSDAFIFSCGGHFRGKVHASFQ